MWDLCIASRSLEHRVELEVEDTWPQWFLVRFELLSGPTPALLCLFGIKVAAPGLREPSGIHRSPEQEQLNKSRERE
jgi:hypothetical protein